MSIDVCDVRFGYGQRAVLKGVSFHIPKGHLVSLLGPNGVGKSTLLKCMLGLLGGYEGSIAINGADVRTLSKSSLAKEMAYIPQAHHPAFNYTCLDMVLMGRAARSAPFASPGKEAEAIALQSLARVGLADFAARHYLQLSGGERQLVLIARALAQQSPILIMDEPTANLDYGNQIRVLSYIRSLAKEGYTILQSTHNPDQAALFSHQILAMQNGQILASGAPEDVLNANLIEQLYGLDLSTQHALDAKRYHYLTNRATEDPID